jgi:hypothetical protein
MIPEMAKSASPSLRGLFDRIDRDQSGSIERKDLETHLSDLGIGGGLLGGSILKKAVNAVLTKLDADGDGSITWQEFVVGGKHLLPPGLLDPSGKLDANLAAPVFASIAGSSPLAGVPAVQAFVAHKLKGTPMSLLSGTISEGAAKVAVDALDGDGDGGFSHQDLVALIQDINAELAKV